MDALAQELTAGLPDGVTLMRLGHIGLASVGVAFTWITLGLAGLADRRWGKPDDAAFAAEKRSRAPHP